ncbi:MAG: winged helix-turn-helix domain-containing tetratricopeptide repeat protein [Acetobacteraceae bacterium]
MADPHDIFLFEGFRFDRRGGGLFQRNESGLFAPVPVGPRALDVLRLLLERAGELVSRDEIIAATWPETVVEDNNLNMQIAALRRVLDGERTAPSCIQTIPRRGYRFIVPVTRAELAVKPAPAQPLHPPEPDDAHRPSGPTSRPHSWIRHPIMAGVVGALMLAAAAATAWKSPPRWLLGASPVPRLSIVVLPFANLAGDPTQQYFADGITEDLTTDLSRLADMVVISRDTAFTYRDKPVNTKQIRRELGVRYVLEGSVQRSGNQVRVNAQLIDTDTDTHLWAERFDRGIGDLLDLQDEITGHIAIALSLRLIASEADRPSEHPDALDHIFRGRAAIYEPASRQNFAAAIAEFEQALALNPRSVEARARLAVALTSRALDGMSGAAKSDLERADRLIGQALAAAPNDPLAHFAKAQLLRARHHCEAAIPEYEAMLAANRNSLPSIGNIGRCKIYLGLVDDGVALEEQAIRLSPHDPFRGVWYFRIGQARLLQSHIDEAILWLEKAHNENSAFPFVAAWLAAAYGLKGDLPRAAAELAEARRLSGNGSPASIAVARARSAKDFTAPASRAFLETTYLAGLRQAGVPEE